MPYGPGLSALLASAGANSLSLVSLPAYDGEQGGRTVGYLAGLPGFTAEDISRATVQPTGDDDSSPTDPGVLDGMAKAVREAMTRETATTIPDMFDKSSIHDLGTDMPVVAPDLEGGFDVAKDAPQRENLREMP